jgi:hypothetical protein
MSFKHLPIENRNSAPSVQTLGARAQDRAVRVMAADVADRVLFFCRARSRSKSQMQSGFLIQAGRASVPTIGFRRMRMAPSLHPHRPFRPTTPSSRSAHPLTRGRCTQRTVWVDLKMRLGIVVSPTQSFSCFFRPNTRRSRGGFRDLFFFILLYIGSGAARAGHEGTSGRAQAHRLTPFRRRLHVRRTRESASSPSRGSLGKTSSRQNPFQVTKTLTLFFRGTRRQRPISLILCDHLRGLRADDA